MKTLIKSAIVAGICLLAAGGANAQSTQFYTQNVTLAYSPTSNLTSNFTFTKFNSSLGNLTAVDLLMTSSTAGGSFSLDTNTNGFQSIVSGVSAQVRSGSTSFGLSNQLTSAQNLSASPSFPYTQPEDSVQTYSISNQSLIGSTQIYSVNFAPYLSNYQSVDGSGTTANFSGRLLVNLSQTTSGNPTQNWVSFTAPTSFTLRYTYTPSVNPVPEPGQVAASLLLLGGIGGYIFIKRRRKPAVAAA